MCIYAILANLPSDEFINHFSGFLGAFEALATSRGTSQREITYFSLMYADILHWIVDYSLRDFTESDNFSRLLALTSKKADGIEVVANYQRTTSWRLNLNVHSHLFRLYFMYGISRRYQSDGWQSWVYEEMMSVAEAIGSQLRSLTVTLSPSTLREQLKRLQLLGEPPFNVVQVVQASTHPFWHSHALEIFFTCFYHLQYFILFEDQDPCNTIGLNDIDVAFTVCRLIATITTVHNKDRYHYFPMPRIIFQALFVAGLVLAELNRPDGMLSPLPCAN